jgi:hypothetical protein
MRAGGADCLARKAIQQVRSSVECLDPVVSRHRGLNHQRVEHIIGGVKRTLGSTILWRDVCALYPQDDLTRGQECTGGGIVELTTIVTLDGFDGATKLCENKGKKADNVGKVSDLARKGKVRTK